MDLLLPSLSIQSFIGGGSVESLFMCTDWGINLMDNPKVSWQPLISSNLCLIVLPHWIAIRGGFGRWPYGSGDSEQGFVY